MTSTIPPKIEILGCQVLPFTDEIQAASALLNQISINGSKGYSIAINAEKLYSSNRQPRLHRIIKHSTFPVVDGAGAVLAIQLLLGKKTVKIDLPRLLLEVLNKIGGSLAVIGASPLSNQLAIGTIATRYPKIKLVFAANGYSNLAETQDHILEHKPTAVLVGMGTPKQEDFIENCIGAGSESFYVGCGGAIDILGGVVQRAPTVMVDWYLEWLYRLVKQPSRWRRQLVLPYFMISLMREFLAKKRSRK